MRGSWRERPFDQKSRSLASDLDVIAAVRRVIGDWDGENWSAVLAVLRHDGLSDVQIRKMTLRDIRNHFDVGQHAIIVKLGGMAYTKTSDIWPSVESTSSTAAADRRSQNQSQLSAITNDHQAILAVLMKTPTKCMQVQEVASAGTIRNRETVGRLLDELKRGGWVHQPYGVRKGYALTDQVLNRLNALRRTT
jgi:hypothetical protein